MPAAGVPGIPPRLWLDARTANHRLLIFDYDGTLAPFKVKRNEAFPLPSTLEKLKSVAGYRGTEIVIVSGRPVRELDALLGPGPFTLVGEHGWETKRPGSAITQEPVPDLARLALERAVDTTSSREWYGWVEQKRTCLMLHTRGRDPETAGRTEGECARLWRFAIDAGLELRCVDGGLELCIQGQDEALTIRRLAARLPRTRLVVYIGDDDTDERAFQAIRSNGYGIRVGDPTRPSRANGRIVSPEQIAVFLETWLLRVEGL